MWSFRLYFCVSIIFCLITLSNARYLTNIPSIRNGTFGVRYTLNTNKDLSSVIEYTYDQTSQMRNPVRIHINSTDASKEFPVMVVAKQQLGIASWQIPYTYGNNKRATNLPISRTVCPMEDSSLQLNAMMTMMTIDVSTFSQHTIQVNVMAEFDVDFYLEMGKTVTVYASPSQPQYFQASFPSDVDHVFVHIISSDSICSYVSIQDAQCPVYDLETNLKFKGSYQSMTKSSSLVAMKSELPHGFFVVVVVSSDDDVCDGQPTGLQAGNRMKMFSITVTEMLTKTEFTVAVYGVLGFFLSFYIIAVVVVAIVLKCSCKEDLHANLNFQDMAMNEDVIPNNEEENNAAIQIRNKTNRQSVYLNSLATKGEKRLVKKSTAYCWAAIVIAVLYAVPVIQLVLSYQKIFNITGNQDTCYYNFLCAYPNGFFSDFNHMYSNIGYILLGFLFCFIVYSREIKFKALIRKYPQLSEDYGIPKHFGFFYAMGVALVMEGVLSGCYHICPSRTNFQFDTSFMYMISGLCMLKIYHTRHPDVNANVVDAALFYAGVIALAVLGVFIQNIAKWIIFFFLYLFICVTMSVKVYHVGLFKWGAFAWDKQVVQKSVCNVINEYRKPKYKNRLILLTVGFCINLALNIAGLVLQPGDFDTFLLAIFIVNLLLYLIYYITMKNVKNEKIYLSTWCFTVLSLASWITSLYFFVSHKYMKTSASPSVSREVNINCILFDFYDYHDVWHFLSAIGMFFSFLTLLGLDDELAMKERRKIAVF